MWVCVCVCVCARARACVHTLEKIQSKLLHKYIRFFGLFCTVLIIFSKAIGNIQECKIKRMNRGIVGTKQGKWKNVDTENDVRVSSVRFLRLIKHHARNELKDSMCKSNETPTWCNTVQGLFLQSHSTCFGRKRPWSRVFKTSTAATGTCVIVAGRSSHLFIRAATQFRP